MTQDFPVKLKHKSLKKAKKLDIHPEDIEEQFIRGSGHGGQKINTSASTVQLKHLPTGIEVRCQEHREQAKNRMTAYRILIDKIEDHVKGKKSERAQKMYKIRKQKKRRSRRAKEKLREIKKRRAEKIRRRKPVDLPDEFH